MTKKEVVSGFCVGAKVTTKKGHRVYKIISWKEYEDWHGLTISEMTECEKRQGIPPIVRGDRIPIRALEGPLVVWSCPVKNLIKVSEHKDLHLCPRCANRHTTKGPPGNEDYCSKCVAKLIGSLGEATEFKRRMEKAKQQADKPRPKLGQRKIQVKEN